MKKSILKFQLDQTDTQTLQMPKDAVILSLQVQNDNPVLYALVNPAPDFEFEENENADKESRTFRLFETAEDFDDDNLIFIGTVMLEFGKYVLHVFEEKS